MVEDRKKFEGVSHAISHDKENRGFDIYVALVRDEMLCGPFENR